MKRVWLVLFILLFLSSPLGAQNTHNLQSMQREMQAFFGEALRGYIHSGCAPAVPVSSLTFNPFACTGYVQDGAELYYANQAATALGPLNAGNGTYWLALHRSTTDPVAGWTRQLLTRYVWQQSATQPNTPSGAVLFARVTVAGGVIAEVDQFGPRGGVVPSLGLVHVRDFGADGVGDDHAAIQAAVNGLPAEGGVVLLGDQHGAMTYTVNAEILSDKDHVYLVGLGRNTTIKPGVAGISVIRHAGSDGGVRNLTIDCAGLANTTGLAIAPEDESQTTVITHQNYNTFRDLHILSCAEGIRQVTGPDVGGADSGNWYNTFAHIHIQFCTLGINLIDHPTDASVSQVNRNNWLAIRVGQTGTNTGLWCQACATNTFTGVHFEGIQDGTSPSAVPTAIVIEGQSRAGGDNNDNVFFGTQFEANTRDIDIRTSNATTNKFIGISGVPQKVVDNGNGTTIIGASFIRHQSSVIDYSSITGALVLNPFNGVSIPGTISNRFAVNGTIAAGILGLGNIAAVSAPNSNFGYALALLSDSVGRNLILGSNDFNAGTNTGTSLSLSTGATHFSAATAGGSSATPVVFGPQGIQPGALTHAGLPAAANGTVVYCSNCTPNSNPCTDAGTGAIAKRLNGAWDCR